MSQVRIELNIAGVGELLKSDEVGAHIKSIADDMAAACGSGYASDKHTNNTRIVASVYTANKRAAKDNAKNNTLLKAVDK